MRLKTPRQCLPTRYEVEKYRQVQFSTDSQQQNIKPLMFENTWGDVYLQAEPYIDTYFSLITETVATGQRYHLTEKTFKPIALGMPFVLLGTQGSLKYLRSYGFKTFEGIWDESYDDAEDQVRAQRIASLLRSLDELTPAARQDLFEQCIPVIEHNWNHFYNGGFEQILWQELSDMLGEIRAESCV
jgi:hypothetical protein